METKAEAHLMTIDELIAALGNQDVRNQEDRSDWNEDIAQNTQISTEFGVTVQIQGKNENLWHIRWVTHGLGHRVYSGRLIGDREHPGRTNYRLKVVELVEVDQDRQGLNEPHYAFIIYPNNIPNNGIGPEIVYDKQLDTGTGKYTRPKGIINNITVFPSEERAWSTHDGGKRKKRKYRKRKTRKSRKRKTRKSRKRKRRKRKTKKNKTQIKKRASLYPL